MSINQINRYHDVINRYELSVFQMPMDTFHLLITIRYFPHSSSTGFVRWIVRLMSHVEQELISLPEHLSSLPVLSGVRVAQSFVFCRYVKWDQWQLLQNGALKSDSTHHFFRNACTKSRSLRFSQFSVCWLILSVYILMSFDFPFVRLFGVR